MHRTLGWWESSGHRWDTGNASDCAEKASLARQPQGGQTRASGSVRPHEQSRAEDGNPWPEVAKCLSAEPVLLDPEQEWSQYSPTIQYAMWVLGSNFAPIVERDEFLVAEKIQKRMYSTKKGSRCYIVFRTSQKFHLLRVLKNKMVNSLPLAKPKQGSTQTAKQGF